MNYYEFNGDKCDRYCVQSAQLDHFVPNFLLAQFNIFICSEKIMPKRMLPHSLLWCPCLHLIGNRFPILVNFDFVLAFH